MNNVFQHGTPFLLRSTSRRKWKLSLWINQWASHANISCVIGILKKWARERGGKRLFKTTLSSCYISKTVCLRHYGAFSKLSTFRTKDSCTPSSGGCFIYSFCSGLWLAQIGLLLVFLFSKHCCSVSPKKMTRFNHYIDSSSVKSPGIRGHTDYVFLLSCWIHFHLEESTSQSGITFLTIIYKLCTASVWIEKGFHISSINSD